MSCFETRFDGELPTVEGPNPLPAIQDGRWAENCVSNSQDIREIPAGTSLVEIRMVYGGESDERFNWEVNLLP